VTLIENLTIKIVLIDEKLTINQAINR